MRLLHTTDGYGKHKYYIDGVHCTRDKWEDFWKRAKHRESMVTVRKNGQWYFYTEVRMRELFVEVRL